ncbi:hypothetical protein CA223_06870 [Sphingomonas koreensis]|uniref:Uncharacterized protein n=1 Tax=Sphingomonas koreensis TaxID=93064 RepID=A0A1L6J7N2_9SPHN|nr:hypothetical protein BRX40_05610 [Sphingomonas koreensis]RSU22783.1 hypothetical protein CA224_05230 [Sphingomonas koreensis]RSU30743.1 hypothetical protein CA222_01315 [Sphingomonas koreensis]RSU31838.1 hypothetical protein CA225_00395 [Sphingomonas koreensis]RSU39241.1 hypothetical protein BRX39_01135 [Sphingomonas koreensis]
MFSAWEAVFGRYGWILIGLTFGFAAKYALLLKRGVRVKAKLVVADLLLLPTVALIAYTIAAKSGASGESAALITTFCTVCADRLVKLYTDRFMDRVDREATAVADAMLGRARAVVATEQSGQRIVEDTIEGRAPTEYAALKPHPQAPAK